MRIEHGANDEFVERFKITFDKLLKLNVILKLDPRYSNFFDQNNFESTNWKETLKNYSSNLIHLPKRYIPGGAHLGFT